MTPVTVKSGTGPVVLGQPHGGTWLPDDLLARLNARGRTLADTDWHINMLYADLLAGATIVQSHVHRYVIDANRDPEGVSLYPGQNTTTLCPLTDFDGEEIWQKGQEPSTDEIEARRIAYHAPYHAALAEELARVKSLHGAAILYDCHSIRSDLPFLFEGTLSVNNIGTNGGETCHRAIENAVFEACQTAAPDQTVLNGRFKGGWTTRHYGRPADGVHAIQMETAQRAYMQESAPWTYLPDQAEAQRVLFRDILNQLDHLARSGALAK